MWLLRLSENISEFRPKHDLEAVVTSFDIKCSVKLDMTSLSYNIINRVQDTPALYLVKHKIGPMAANTPIPQHALYPT